MQVRKWQKEIECKDCGCLLTISEEDILFKKQKSELYIDRDVAPGTLGTYFIKCECGHKIEIDLWDLPIKVVYSVTKKSGEFRTFRKKRWAVKVLWA